MSTSESDLRLMLGRYEHPGPAQVRKRLIGWQARGHIHRYTIGGGMSDDLDPIKVWRPTKAWAVWSATAHQERRWRAWERQEGIGVGAWTEPENGSDGS